MPVELSSQTNPPALSVLETLASCHPVETDFAVSTELRLLLN